MKLMNARALDDLYSVIDAFKLGLKSVDVRTVAVKPSEEELWQNLVTSINISEKTLGEVIVEQSKMPSVRNKDFAIFRNAFALTEAEVTKELIFSQIETGQLYFPTSEGWFVVQVRKFDPFSLKVGSRWDYVRGVQKYFLGSTASGKTQERERLWLIANNQHQEVKRQNYQDIQELINDTCKTKDYSNGSVTDFEIRISCVAHIETSFFKGKLFVVKIRKPIGVAGLQLNLNLKRYTAYPYQTVWKTTFYIDEVEKQTIEFVAQPEGTLPFDQMNIELIHKNSALVLDSIITQAPLINVAEPLVKTLDSFCPLNEFKRMLLEPQKCGKQPQKIFENAVAWLLSMAGFCTIHLGIEVRTLEKGIIKTDRLTLENKFQIGAADIVAYEENNRILLVDCDIGPFDDKKLQALSETQKHIEATANELKPLRIVAALFCPLESNEIARQNPNVRVIDKYGIERMFEQVVRGDREMARHSII